ncbi:hypothetical protein C8F01DRAFT_1102963 [Mycena amicta]|nr:hypothetical protein C8F01DRAFT_1102963 [Mycena amicta]
MVDLTRLVKAEKATSTDNKALNLRRIFEYVGEIRAIHASGFIEFSDGESAQRAVALEIPGVRVFDVASSPRLAEQYRKVNPSAFTEGPTEDKPRPAPPSSPKASILRSLKSAKPVSSHPRRRPLSHPSVSSAAPATTPSAPLDDHILIRLCGEIITLDLSSLASDPATIIELLRLPACDRGNWLIVAAYYRRMGNHKCAKEVMEAMLEAVKTFNIPDNDLKPAFLLLSGCETDLGKMEKLKGDSEKASKHYGNAGKWLRKVYGSNPPPESDNPRGTFRPGASLRTRIEARASPGPDYRKLEREVQSLRDRHARDTTLISEFRTLKRRLEDSIAVERAVRRRMDSEVDQLIRERDGARRMVTIANEQLQRRH